MKASSKSTTTTTTSSSTKNIKTKINYNLSTNEISRHGLDVVGWLRVKEGSKNAERIFRSNFGTGSKVIQEVWRLIGKHIPDQEIEQDKKRLDHLFWAFLLLKVYATETNHCTMVHEKPTEKTFRKWSWKYLRYISYLFPYVVSKNKSIIYYYLYLYLIIFDSSLLDLDIHGT